MQPAGPVCMAGTRGHYWLYSRFSFSFPPLSTDYGSFAPMFTGVERKDDAYAFPAGELWGMV